VNSDFNASVSVYGLRHRRLLTIGLPLWEILSPDERVALLGHELAHFSNGDQRHGGILQSALFSLEGWRYLLAPNEDEGNSVEMVVTVVTFPPFLMIVGIQLLMYRLTVRSSQRGEYLADGLGARVGGTASAIRLLDRVLLEPFVMRSMERVRARLRLIAREGDGPAPKPEQLWHGLAEEVAAMPEHEVERLRRVGEKVAHAVDATHPPTHLRRKVLALATPVPPEVVVDASRAARIQTELAESRHTIATLMQGAHELG
jgi:Zn-dependent protease with chaperone function